MAITLVLNGLIAATGAFAWSSSLQSPSFAPPGGTIGAVWIVIFALMGTALWQLGGWRTALKHRALQCPAHIVNARKTIAARAILAMFAVNCAFPLYAIVPRSVLAGFIGTAASLPLAWIVIAVSLRANRNAGLAMLPLGLWLSYAVFVAHASWQLNG